MDGFNLPEKLKHSLFCDIETRFCYIIMDVEKNIVFKTSKNALDGRNLQWMKLQKNRRFLCKERACRTGNV